MGIDYMAPYGAFLGSSAKNGYPKIVQRGDLLGRRGVESLKGRPPPPPLNARLISVKHRMCSDCPLATIEIF